MYWHYAALYFHSEELSSRRVLFPLAVHLPKHKFNESTIPARSVECHSQARFFFWSWPVSLCTCLNPQAPFAAQRVLSTLQAVCAVTSHHTSHHSVNIQHLTIRQRVYLVFEISLAFPVDCEQCNVWMALTVRMAVHTVQWWLSPMHFPGFRIGFYLV